MCYITAIYMWLSLPLLRCCCGAAATASSSAEVENGCTAEGGEQWDDNYPIGGGLSTQTDNIMTIPLVAGYLRKRTNIFRGFPCHLLGSGEAESNAFFFGVSSATFNAPSTATGVQTCVAIYPRPPCLPRTRKCEKEPSVAAGHHA